MLVIIKKDSNFHLDGNFFKIKCDKMPYNLQWHLPSIYTWNSIHRMMQREVDGPTLVYSKLCTLWADEFEHVKIPKKNLFAKCKTCILLSEEKLKVKNKEATEILNRALKYHAKFQCYIDVNQIKTDFWI